MSVSKNLCGRWSNSTDSLMSILPNSALPKTCFRRRTQGAWEEWLAFFLEGTEITARSAADSAKQILTLFAKDRDRIQTIGRAAPSALRVHEYMQRKPLVSIGAAAEELKLSIPTVTVALDCLAQLGIANEVREGVEPGFSDTRVI